jgi:hypothetical protein
MRDKNVQVNSLASNPVLQGMRDAAKPYVEMMRKQRQMILAMKREQKARTEQKLAVAQ